MKTKSIYKILKKGLTLFLGLLLPLYFAFPGPVSAANLEVTFESDPLFPSTIVWYPGLSVTKSVTVKNNGTSTEKVAIEALNESETGNLASVLEFKVTEGGVERYNSSKTLKNFFNEGVIQLSDLGAGKTTTYDLTVTFRSTAGNEYQEKEVKFDFRIGSWEEVAGGGGVVSPGVTVGPVAAPVCTAPAPPAPILLSATPTASVVLTWTPVSPVTHYLVAYGLTSGSYIYGNPNVGNVTSFTVHGLSAGVTYYFVVAGVNDCMPGPSSNELSSPGGLVLGAVTASPPPGFVPIGEIGVMGEATAAAIPEVAGITTPLMGKPVCFWWWVILVLEAIILLLYYWSIRKGEKRPWFIFPIALGVVAFFVHELAYHFYIPSRFCPWFWLGDLLVLVATTLFYFARWRKT